MLGIDLARPLLRALTTRGARGHQVNETTGVRESDTGLAHPAHWDLVSDKQAMQEEQPLQVRCPDDRRNDTPRNPPRATEGGAAR